MGRRTLLDDIVLQKIVAATERGLPRDTCAALAGVTPRTLYSWLAKGREGGEHNENYVQLLHRVKSAEARGEQELVDIIRNAARNGTWVAAAWLLERRRPLRYALRKPEPREQEVSPEEAKKLLAEAAELHERLKAGSK